jgi:hypothetical protein
MVRSLTNTQKFTRDMVMIATILSIISLRTQVVVPFTSLEVPGVFISFFNLDLENKIPTGFSSVLLATSFFFYC